MLEDRLAGRIGFSMRPASAIVVVASSREGGRRGEVQGSGPKGGKPARGAFTRNKGVSSPFGVAGGLWQYASPC